MQSAAAILGAHGQLCNSIAGFAPRAAQQQMASLVEQSLAESSTLVVEAGTGTGKTYAYLLPAILSGQKVIISTGTRPLQDQLYRRDLPLLLKKLGLSCKASLLKGRSNYLCCNRLAQVDIDYADKQQKLHLHRIEQWAKTTGTGDLAELNDLPENSPLFAKICSTIDFCVDNPACRPGRCFLQNARRRAQEADLVVVNHHLFMADMALRQHGKGEVLPSATAYIFDEAHQLPDVASHYFGSALSSTQLLDLYKNAMATRGLLDKKDATMHSELIGGIEAAVRKLRMAFGAEERRESYQATGAIANAMSQLETHLRALAVCYKPLADALMAELDSNDKPAANSSAAIALSIVNRATEFAAQLQSFNQANPEIIYWLHISRNTFSLQQTPLSIAKLFASSMQTYSGSWVFTSATLAVKDDFSHFVNELGLVHPIVSKLPSPFDYKKNSILFLPEGLPEPQAPDFLERMLAVSLPILKAARGRAFMLFTSYRALNIVAEKLKTMVDYPLFVQGSRPRAQLLDDFRDSGNGVLLGTSSFWEGVDIKGEALSLVIIDKLPFAAPNDPVLAARLDAIRKAGGNPFMQQQLPNAVISLKQGVGRLIRDVNDRGVVVVCDVRLKTKFYGKSFSDSLPPMKRSRTLADIENFFAEHEQ